MHNAFLSHQTINPLITMMESFSNFVLGIPHRVNILGGQQILKTTNKYACDDEEGISL